MSMYNQKDVRVYAIEVFDMRIRVAESQLRLGASHCLRQYVLEILLFNISFSGHVCKIVSKAFDKFKGTSIVH